ncbi:sugar phosphate isomerase/epimerase family protein [Clostridium thermarum]|uniref:sugar phosphate isomerase/epimerase family protein n=1 Tax=Clostridium thermarum TaxID=1716543 RepID=UPI0013D24475|nr:sugar phosphate isomerase/epimerase family protein [Clostridium thermarum]
MSGFTIAAFADEIDGKLDVQMDVLEQHKVRYIEMRGVNGKCIVDYSLDEVREIKSKLDRRGFKISAIGSPIGKINIIEDFAPHLQLFKHTLEVAKILEARYIRMFSFFIPQGESPDKYREEVMNRWRQFIKAAEGYDVILLHENEKDIYGDTAERCLDLVETMNCDYFKLTFDPANFIQSDVKAYPDAYDLLQDQIEYMHIKDAQFSDKRVVVAGQGDAGVKEILTKLREKDYNGFLSLEPHLTNFMGFSDLELDSKEIDELSTDGPKEFARALGALKNLLSEIGEEVI